MVYIRQATMKDIQQIQHCNLQCLPENYQLRYYLYHIVTWPQIIFVAVDESNHGKVVGYVLAKMDEEEKSFKDMEMDPENRFLSSANNAELKKRKERRDAKRKKKRSDINSYSLSASNAMEEEKANANESKKNSKRPNVKDEKIRRGKKWIHGHITSLAVLRSHRKLGLATKLMIASQDQMKKVYRADFISLHVRETNHPAYHLYTHVLKFERFDVERGYYADGEAAYHMRKPFSEYYMKRLAQHIKENPIANGEP